ncbi:hypothetical protein LIA77_11050 [Sarocladium implicatum]|nr:hypothetical protein LIA77_11050 [Sarocladium implicatum]
MAILDQCSVLMLEPLMEPFASVSVGPYSHATFTIDCPAEHPMAVTQLFGRTKSGCEAGPSLDQYCRASGTLAWVSVVHGEFFEGISQDLLGQAWPRCLQRKARGRSVSRTLAARR